VQIHQRLHQVLGGRSYRRVRDGFNFLNQLANPLHVLPYVFAVSHNPPEFALAIFYPKQHRRTPKKME
jgi:anthranilate phosphoribosyltransferase